MRFASLILTLALSTAVAQSVPTEVKQAIVRSVKASNSPTADDSRGGFHEEGGLWGVTAEGTILVIPAKPGKAHATACDHKTVLLNLGDAADPTLSAKLVDVLGEWHVHPSGYVVHDNVTCNFAQPPSSIDIANAMDPVNIVIGADDKMVYFYDHNGVTSKTKLKEFLK